MCHEESQHQMYMWRRCVEWGCRDPREAVVIEDAINGLRAAREAGCLCVGVATTFPTHMLRSHAHVVYERLQDIDIEQLLRFLELQRSS